MIKHVGSQKGGNDLPFQPPSFPQFYLKSDCLGDTVFL